ncbi:MAG: DUF362 domain-containing protein [Desulfobacterales bacterium]|jgi:uncharacterized protein (DUF362 family)|nr:DUF362 domain-containing protein [Desulfobacterales bacterium]
MQTRHKVLIRRCPRYDPERIAAIVREGMQELGVRPRGRILLKPNLVMAHPEIFPHAFTRREFLDGVITAVKAVATDVEELAVGERSGITIATRYSFKNAGYAPIVRQHGLKTYFFDEARQVAVPLGQPQALRRRLFVPEPIARCGFLINLPKFKAHPWCRLTLSLKNFIGLQDDRHRLVDHNQFLEHKIADLQSVIQPGFIAIDAITAGQKMMLTPTPFDLGAVVMGTNSCAVDTVGCHMVHVDPAQVTHLKLSSARGFGPMNLDQIEVGGDFPLEQVRAKTRNFQFCHERVDDYFGPGGNLRCTVGRFPEPHSDDYCWGGCPGALQEAMHILRGFTPEVDRRMGRIRYVVGAVEGPLELAPGEKVIFAGRCTRWQGRINGRRVSIQGSYCSAGEVDEAATASNDMLLKVGQALARSALRLGRPYVHLQGCPVSVAEHVFTLASLGRIGNPLFDRRLLWPNLAAYAAMRSHRLLNRLKPPAGAAPLT